MLTQKWQTSERHYRVREERDFAIPVSDGTKLNSYLYRLDAEGKFPVIWVCTLIPSSKAVMFSGLIVTSRSWPK
jgi:predicted acyl esterase